QPGKPSSDKGAKGSLGKPGTAGSPGLPGSAGSPGIAGLSGKPGEQQRFLNNVFFPTGHPGVPGPPGSPSWPGEQGDDGVPGFPGVSGSKGIQGEMGIVGEPGPPGSQGRKGRYFQGVVSHMPGVGLMFRVAGSPGKPGPSGLPGMPGRHLRKGFLLVIHSQAEKTPTCPWDMPMLWEGYSLLYLVGEEIGHGQDLGSAGSCIPRFSTLPFVPCSTDGLCHYASRNDKSYWLATGAALPSQPLDEEAVYPHVSRCAVCEAPSPPLALHSQAVTLPVCPSGFRSLWLGYSFLMHTGGGSEGSGQSLSSPGSCLEDFRAAPFLECQGARGTCHFFSDALSFWLVALDSMPAFSGLSPAPKTLKVSTLRSHVSRCQVCMRST
uniref:Collagen IV NC1 domain-containing protein n=1 Tax=Eptatretus burgeri TaxID=7764 RepID=A0A8C4QVX5_EPTBU